MDDLSLGANLRDIQNELSTPTFKHSTNFKNFKIQTQADHIVVSRSLKLLHLLDFCAFSIKKFNSSSQFVENTLNVDSRLKIKDLTHTSIRPNADDLQKEILVTRKQTITFANVDPPDFPENLQNTYIFLGMMIDRQTD